MTKLYCCVNSTSDLFPDMKIAQTSINHKNKDLALANSRQITYFKQRNKF